MKPRNVHPIVRQIVDRQHVSTPMREVYRAVIGALRHGKATYRTMSRDDRRALLSDIAYVHKGNLRLYVDVMGGKIR